MAEISQTIIPKLTCETITIPDIDKDPYILLLLRLFNLGRKMLVPSSTIRAHCLFGEFMSIIGKETNGCGKRIKCHRKFCKKHSEVIFNHRCRCGNLASGSACYKCVRFCPICMGRTSTKVFENKQKLCRNHLCHYSRCMKPVPTGSSYCSDHECQYEGCTRRKYARGYSTFCKLPIESYLSCEQHQCRECIMDLPAKRFICSNRLHIVSDDTPTIPWDIYRHYINVCPRIVKFEPCGQGLSVERSPDCMIWAAKYIKYWINHRYEASRFDDLGWTTAYFSEPETNPGGFCPRCALMHRCEICNKNVIDFQNPFFRERRSCNQCLVRVKCQTKGCNNTEIQYTAEKISVFVCYVCSSRGKPCVSCKILYRHDSVLMDDRFSKYFGQECCECISQNTTKLHRSAMVVWRAHRHIMRQYASRKGHDLLSVIAPYFDLSMRKNKEHHPADGTLGLMLRVADLPFDLFNMILSLMDFD